MDNKAYILQNYDKYGLLNRQNKPITRRDMLDLLNILESQNENLDSFHDAAFNSYTEFMDIYREDSFADDLDTYHAILRKYSFFTVNEFIDYILETMQEENGPEFIYELTYDLYGDLELFRTSDGYVLKCNI
ncbi:hypothetical protein [Pseudobutyrivibrio sp.]|uniref:hypothetical protein n=1 Tax=Pseudobutyrivibrio sp. TaxID=2014367 RepID=UPI00386BDF66